MRLRRARMWPGNCDCCGMSMCPATIQVHPAHFSGHVDDYLRVAAEDARVAEQPPGGRHKRAASLGRWVVFAGGFLLDVGYGDLQRLAGSSTSRRLGLGPHICSSAPNFAAEAVLEVPARSAGWGRDSEPDKPEIVQLRALNARCRANFWCVEHRPGRGRSPPACSADPSELPHTPKGVAPPPVLPEAGGGLATLEALAADGGVRPKFARHRPTLAKSARMALNPGQCRSSLVRARPKLGRCRPHLGHWLSVSPGA